MTTVKVEVSKKLASIIGSRDVAYSLKSIIEKTHSKTIDLDFHDVEFVSRSAAHELLLLKETLNKRFFRKKVINFVNASDNVSEMFRTVAANRALPKHKELETDIQNVDINYLSKLATS
jgi:anti-anti-sigma regulatory factor